MGIPFTMGMGFLLTMTMGKLFTMTLGIQLTISSAQKMFYELSRKAGLTSHSVHDLRHTAASMMAQAGDNVVQIARWLRQKQVASAERYLSDIDREKHERDMEKRASRFL